MFKLMLWIIVGFLAIIGIVMIVAFVKFQYSIKQVSPEYIVKFFKDYKAGDDVALSIHHDGEKWVSINEQIPLPLASTVQIIIAIEFAQQAADRRIDPEQEISLKELDLLNIPKTDGGAHQTWINSLELDKDATHVPLNEVVNGMMKYSSNANTDFLMDILGLENINKVPEQLGLPNHDPLFPIISSMFVPVKLMSKKTVTQQALLAAFRDLSNEEFRQMTIDIHKEWTNNPPSAQEKRQLIKTLNVSVQRAWSERLPRATTEGYISIMDKINNRDYFSTEVHKYLDPLLEHRMSYPENQERFIHFGQKGGTTSFSITMIMYATDKNNRQTSLALLANNLNAIEQIKLSRSLNDFQRKFLTDESFQDYVKDELADQVEPAELDDDSDLPAD